MTAPADSIRLYQTLFAAGGAVAFLLLLPVLLGRWRPPLADIGQAIFTMFIGFVIGIVVSMLGASQSSSSLDWKDRKQRIILWTVVFALAVSVSAYGGKKWHDVAKLEQPGAPATTVVSER